MGEAVESRMLPITRAIAPGWELHISRIEVSYRAGALEEHDANALLTWFYEVLPIGKRAGKPVDDRQRPPGWPWTEYFPFWDGRDDVGTEYMDYGGACAWDENGAIIDATYSLSPPPPEGAKWFELVWCTPSEEWEDSIRLDLPLPASTG